MDINKHIIDQRIRKMVEDRPEWFSETTNSNQKISKAFVILGVASALEIDISEAYSSITEGGNDAGIDALYVGDVSDTDFTVILFQAKYHFNLEKEYDFPANAVLRIVNSIGTIFNPKKDIILNNSIKPKVEEIRSLILDGYIPNIRCIMLNNGNIWKEEGIQHIENANFPKEQVSFNHYNHSDIAKQLQSTKPISDTVVLTGKAIIENFAFKRVLVGKISVAELAKLMDRHGNALLEKNIRKYLGLHKNRVNQSIQNTLLDENKRGNFYFFNNGITMLCNKFRHNELMDENWQLKINDLQIINGGQTSKTILKTVLENPSIDFSKATVLVRLYEVSNDDEDAISLTTDITIATNSQTPVDLRDLRANDSLQQKLGLSIDDLNYKYLTKKGTGSSLSSSQTIPSSVAAEAVFTTWKGKPHIAKYKKSELFGKFYFDVFNEINAAQLIISVFIFRYCDAKRKNTSLISARKHIAYSNYFLAMLCSQMLLSKMEIELSDLSHVNFETVKTYWNENSETIYETANFKLEKALEIIFPNGLDDIDPRRLAATFRRGDLLSVLNSVSE